MIVNNWKQQGRIYLWHYLPTRSKYAGWHVTADVAGSESVVNLIDQMESESKPALRTISLTGASAHIAAVPSFGDMAHGAPGKMRLKYEPADQNLGVSLEDDRLLVQFGKSRLADLRSAFVEVGIGGGDFALWPDQAKGGLPLWFWWLPQSGKQRF